MGEIAQEKGIRNVTLLEDPYIEIYKAKYGTPEERRDLQWTDYYYAALVPLSLGVATPENIVRAKNNIADPLLNPVKNVAGKIKGLLFERGKIYYEV